jgi:hypothetical protein
MFIALTIYNAGLYGNSSPSNSILPHLRLCNYDPPKPYRAEAFRTLSHSQYSSIVDATYNPSQSFLLPSLNYPYYNFRNISLRVHIFRNRLLLLGELWAVLVYNIIVQNLFLISFVTLFYYKGYRVVDVFFNTLQYIKTVSKIVLLFSVIYLIAYLETSLIFHSSLQKFDNEYRIVK